MPIPHKKKKCEEKREGGGGGGGETKARNMFGFPPLFTAAEFPKLSGATDPLPNITISVPPLHKFI